MKKIIYPVLVTLICASFPAAAQMPDTPPPSNSKMDPRLEKRVRELKQLGHDKKKDPEAQDSASNNASDDVASDDTKLERSRERNKMRILRRKGMGARPEVKQRLKSFALTSRLGRENKKHLIRLAKLERLAAIAAETDNKTLAKRVVDLRFQENRRHQTVLTRIEEAQAKRANPPDIKVKIDGEPAQP